MDDRRADQLIRYGGTFIDELMRGSRARIAGGRPEASFARVRD
jgi:hypothetical protein